MRVTRGVKDVHTEHCCKLHGCKYGDEDCTVVNGSRLQSYRCQDCLWDDIELEHEKNDGWLPI